MADLGTVGVLLEFLSPTPNFPSSYTDVTTVPGVTTPSGTDTLQRGDSVTIGSATSLTTTTPAGFVDTATVKSVTTPRFGSLPGLDSATFATVTQVIVSVESAKISTVTTVIVEVEEFAGPTGQWGPFDLDSGAI